MRDNSEPHQYSDHFDYCLGFDAMRQFLENWWERSGRPDHTVFEMGDVLWLLNACAPREDGSPKDPAMWSDWEDAVAQARKNYRPPQS